jgi:hypothetical protein
VGADGGVGAGALAGVDAGAALGDAAAGGAGVGVGVLDHVGVGVVAGAGGAGAAAAGGDGGAGAAVDAPGAAPPSVGAPEPGRDSMCPRMSCLVTRPAMPVPGTCRRSTWCSAAILRTTGDERCRSSSGVISERGLSAAGDAGAEGAGAELVGDGAFAPTGPVGVAPGAGADGAGGAWGADGVAAGGGADGAGGAGDHDAVGVVDAVGVEGGAGAGVAGVERAAAKAAAAGGAGVAAADAGGALVEAAGVPSAWGDLGGAAAVPGGTAAGGVAEAVSPSPMTPTTVLMGTVDPGSTRISLSTPEAGAGISASTLSVEISKRGSSRCTRSPTFFIHLVIVPSAIDSPICGMMTSVIRAIPRAGGGGAAPRAGAG